MNDAASPGPAPDALKRAEAALWAELANATRDPGHEWRHAVLATVDGDAADARVVVLREIDRPRLLFYSDARAGKLLQMRQHPVGTMVFWSRSLNWQLRARVRMQALDGGLAVSSRWARLKLTPAAQDYLSPLPPGAEWQGRHAEVASRPQPAEPPRGERGHFAVVEAEVTGLDWLDLRPGGHRRARFEVPGVARWLHP